MGVETSADLAVFFNLDDFGTAATYTPSGGQAATVNGIFDREFIETHENDAGVGLEGRRPVFSCRRADVSSPSLEDTFLINGVTYYVAGLEDSADGAVVKIILTEAVI